MSSWIEQYMATQQRPTRRSLLDEYRESRRATTPRLEPVTVTPPTATFAKTPEGFAQRLTETRITAPYDERAATLKALSVAGTAAKKGLREAAPDRLARAAVGGIASAPTAIASLGARLVGQRDAADKLGRISDAIMEAIAGKPETAVGEAAQFGAAAAPTGGLVAGIRSLRTVTPAIDKARAARNAVRGAREAARAIVPPPVPHVVHPPASPVAPPAPKLLARGSLVTPPPAKPLTGEQAMSFANREAMLSRTRKALPPDDPLRALAERTRASDDLERFADARSPGGAIRPVARVQNDALVREWVDASKKLEAAQERSLYHYTEADVSGSQFGVVIPTATRRSGQPSMQAKAMQTAALVRGRMAKIEAELARRGLDEDEITTRLLGAQEETNAPRLAAKAERTRVLDEARDAMRVTEAERGGLRGEDIIPYQVGDGRGFNLFSAGAGGVAGAGATEDEENVTARQRAVAIAAGVVVGAAGGSYLLRRARQAGQPLRMIGDPDADAILNTIARGPREAAKGDELVTKAGKTYTALVDQLYPMREFGKRIGGTQRLSHEATRASGWEMAAEQFAVDELGPIVRATIEGSSREKVMALAKAQRDLSLLDRGLVKTDIPRDVSERVVARYSADPDVRAGADALQAYYRKLLQYKRDNGVITPEQFDDIVAKEDYYTPFTREWDEIAGGVAGPGGGRFVNRGSGVRRMDEGLARAKTVDPFEQATFDTMETYRTVAKQRVSNVLAEIVETDDIAAYPFIRRVAGPKSADAGRVVAANINGERRFYEVVDQDLFNAWASFTPPEHNLLVRAIAPFKRVLQTTVTALPDWAGSNGIRDNLMSAIQYPLSSRATALGTVGGAAVGAVTAEEGERGAGALRGAAFGLGAGALAPNIARTMTAMRSIIRKDVNYKEWIREGGASFGGFYPKTPKDAQRMLKELERTGVQASDIISPKRWWGALQAIGRTVEQAPRLAAFTEARAAGASAAEAVAKGADISLDFSKIGSGTRGIAATTAFWNAKVQGWDKLIRMLKNPRTYAAGAATITAPTIALWTVNKDNPEYWARPQWERNLFWLVPKGGEDGGFWRIPKPFEVGFIFASIPERILDYTHQQDPETLRFALTDMLSTATEGSIPILPTAVEPIVENLANYDFFKNRPVVARPDLPAELQSDAHTSSLALAAGKVGVSPQKAQNVIEGYTGGAGRVASGVIDRVARATGLDDRPLPPGTPQLPVIGDLGRRFTTQDNVSSDAEQAVRRRFERSDEAYRGFNELVKRGDQAALRTFVANRREDLAAYDALRTTMNALQEVSQARRALLLRRDVSVATRDQMLQRLSTLAMTIAARQSGQAVAASVR